MINELNSKLFSELWMVNGQVGCVWGKRWSPPAQKNAEVGWFWQVRLTYLLGIIIKLIYSSREEVWGHRRHRQAHTQRLGLPPNH